MADRTGRHFIDGQWTDGAASEALTVINPATEEAIGTAPNGTAGDAADAIRAARRAFDEGPWPRMSPTERATILGRMGEIMQKRYSELVELSIAEAGSTRMLAEFLQVGLPLRIWMDTVTRVLPQFAFDEPMLTNAVPGLGVGQGIVAREPFGVAALITPFNFPFSTAVLKSAAALSAGCTAVLKPSPYTPFEGLVLGDVAAEAGLPPGVLNIVCGDVPVSEELTGNPMVDIVSFTGSDVIGRKVYGSAAETLKKVVLELGGKSANIICADADLDRAAEEVVIHFTSHTGQGCALLTRTLVHESVHDELVKRVQAALPGIIVGDPADERTMMGPLIREKQRSHVEELIASALDEGAELASGGGRPRGLDKGFFLEPTLFTGVRNTMRIARTEVFGPVGVVIPFSDNDEAIRIANDSDYGLAGGIWSADTANALAMARKLRTGAVNINGGGPGLSPHAPFGGYKHSGLGREFGPFGLSEFLQHKAIQWSVR